MMLTCKQPVWHHSDTAACRMWVWHVAWHGQVQNHLHSGLPVGKAVCYISQVCIEQHANLTRKSAAVASATDADVRGPSNTLVMPAGGAGLPVPQL